MNQKLSFEFRILGGSAQDAVQYIRHLTGDTEAVKSQLDSLLGHELSHMNRTSVIKVIEARMKKLNKSGC